MTTTPLPPGETAEVEAGVTVIVAIVNPVVNDPHKTGVQDVDVQKNRTRPTKGVDAALALSHPSSSR